MFYSKGFLYTQCPEANNHEASRPWCPDEIGTSEAEMLAQKARWVFLACLRRVSIGGN